MVFWRPGLGLHSVYRLFVHMLVIWTLEWWLGWRWSKDYIPSLFIRGHLVIWDTRFASFHSQRFAAASKALILCMIPSPHPFTNLISLKKPLFHYLIFDLTALNIFINLNPSQPWKLHSFYQSPKQPLKLLWESRMVFECQAADQEETHISGSEPRVIQASF